MLYSAVAIYRGVEERRYSSDESLAVAIAADAGARTQVTSESGRLVDGSTSVRQPLVALLVVIILLAAGCVIVVTALGLADARPDYATLAAAVIAAPFVAFALGSAMPRSRLPMVARID